jgi:hypothetical protein
MRALVLTSGPFLTLTLVAIPAGGQNKVKRLGHSIKELRNFRGYWMHPTKNMDYHHSSSTFVSGRLDVK